LRLRIGRSEPGANHSGRGCLCISSWFRTQDIQNGGRRSTPSGRLLSDAIRKRMIIWICAPRQCPVFSIALTKSLRRIGRAPQTRSAMTGQWRNKMRLVLAPLLLSFGALPRTCLAGKAGGAITGGAPGVYFHADIADPTYGSVVLESLSIEQIAQLRRANPSAAQRRSLFSVFVQLEERPENETLPAVLGQYELLRDRVCFTPHLQLVPGLKYRASADLAALLGRTTFTSPTRWCAHRRRPRPGPSNRVVDLKGGACCRA
jgi:hypothetical protein